jgi:hypothetical protein
MPCQFITLGKFNWYNDIKIRTSKSDKMTGEMNQAMLKGCQVLPVLFLYFDEVLYM